MNWTEYQTAAQRTADTTQDDAIRRQLCALGLIGETGEVAELLKHALSHGTPVDIERLKLELGDVCWYVAEADAILGRSQQPGTSEPLRWRTVIGLAARAAGWASRLFEEGDNEGWDGYADMPHCLGYIRSIAYAHGIEFEDILQANVDKLRKRHPQGFSVEASINRGAT